MNVSHKLGRFSTDELYSFVISEGFAPALFKADDLSAVALRHLRNAIGEITVGKHREPGFGLHEIGDGSFHASTTGAGNHQRRAVAGAKRHS